MTDKPKAFKLNKSRMPKPGITGSQLALRLNESEKPQPLDALLSVKPETSVNPTLLSGDWALKEVECAREFNFELPEDLVAAVETMEQAVQNILGVRKCAILVFDETTGVYSCLSDTKVPGMKSRELTRISDHFLQDLMGADGNSLIHSYLLVQNSLVGMVVVADKADGSSLTAQDQMLMNILAPYLAVKVVRYNHLRQSLIVPYIQSMVLELAGHLVTAVDQDSIMTAALETFACRLGFDACQYVGFNAETGLGEVLYEIKNTESQHGQVQSFNHAGLEGKRRAIRDYTNLVGLVSSMGRNRFYLHLNGHMLGDRTLSDIFDLPQLQSALLLPVLDRATGEIRGIFNLFHTTSALISDESCQIAKEVAQLTSQALSRSMVLEKALMMASSDELTGLINRRGYYQRFESELERARRHQTSLCVALIDVDHFKKFNDTYGHLSGDLVLKALAELFTQNLRKSDVVCRFGGEEFAILLPDTSLKSAVDLMDRVRQSVAEMKLRGINGEKLHVTISAGLALVDTKPRSGEHRSEISESLALADEQLYIAKNKGRNQVCFEDDTQSQSSSIQQAS